MKVPTCAERIDGAHHPWSVGRRRGGGGEGACVEAEVEKVEEVEGGGGGGRWVSAVGGHRAVPGTGCSCVSDAVNRKSRSQPHRRTVQRPSTQSQHTVTAHSHNTQSQHTVTAHAEARTTAEQSTIMTWPAPR